MISASTSLGEAARQLVVIVISGSSISGVSWMGRRARLIRPKIRINASATSKATGLASPARVMITARRR